MLHVKPNPKKLTALVYLLIIYAAHNRLTKRQLAWRGVRAFLQQRDDFLQLQFENVSGAGGDGGETQQTEPLTGHHRIAKPSVTEGNKKR